MSLKFEEYNALKSTRDFLFEILHRPVRSWTSEELKGKSRNCLRHYPLLTESGEPMFSNDKES